MDANSDQSSPPAAADGAGRVFVVFGVDAADADAKLAALAGPDGPGPHDDVVVIRWLSEGEPPPGQIQPKSLGDALAGAEAEPGAVTGRASIEGSAGK
jgi:hypothetical protein